ncbi:MAG TPA: type II toxin-antitoxin system RelE/ParE family toxin [Bacteroidia bacterium]|nr:type II toxin-antitoxin system RelE/ParE family toxin [Bacteroidia bacterium]
MNIEFTGKFEKQIDQIRDKKLKSEIANIVRAVIAAQTLARVPNLKKLKGYKTAYRIRTGNYRIGIIIQNNVILFAAFADRKDIYKIFP